MAKKRTHNPNFSESFVVEKYVVRVKPKSQFFKVDFCEFRGASVQISQLNDLRRSLCEWLRGSEIQHYSLVLMNFVLGEPSYR